MSWDGLTRRLLLLRLLHGRNRWRSILDSIIVNTRPLSALSSNETRTRFPLVLSAISSVQTGQRACLRRERRGCGVPDFFAFIFPLPFGGGFGDPSCASTASDPRRGDPTFPSSFPSLHAGRSEPTCQPIAVRTTYLVFTDAFLAAPLLFPMPMQLAKCGA